MNSVALLVERREPPTGESVQAWLSQEFSECRTGQSRPIRVAYHGSASFHSVELPYLLVCCSTSTDPGADERIRQSHFVDWSRNLSQLSAAARAIIPGLRDLTRPERNNLRQYYRKLYRKA